MTLLRDGRRGGRRVALLLGALLVAAPGPALLAAGPAQAAGRVCVGVIVDHADSGDTRPTDTFCATVDAGTSGLGVLLARATRLGRTAPRVEGGLVCAIDGFPTTGCGAQDSTRGGFDYWSYWKRPAGTGRWSYSQTGAGDVSHPPGDGDQEGWAFQLGGKEGAKQPPLVDPYAVCTTADRQAAAAAPSSPAAARATTAPPPAAPGSSPATPATPATLATARTSAAAKPAVGVRGGATTRPGASTPASPRATAGPPQVAGPGARTPAPTPSAGGGAASVAAVGTAAPPGSPPLPPAAAAPTATVTPSPSDVAASGSAAPAPSSQSVPPPLPAGVTRAVAEVPRAAGGGGPAWGAILGGVLVLAVGAAAAVRARRSRA